MCVRLISRLALNLEGQPVKSVNPFCLKSFVPVDPLSGLGDHFADPWLSGGFTSRVLGRLAHRRVVGGGG